MKKNQRLLAKAGKALFGPHWQSEMAKVLKCADRTIRRYTAGTSDIPADLWPKLLAVLDQRALEVTEIREHVQAMGLK